ncbi:mannosyltransferase putative-domain-containing protein [Catenaria anguillulae PL171]|uniref:Mannosyltransferase putative-domain-containing protein n=1 Tax=Catenaria anguillulae PL171 TaxID=765915 RepID=A0A1Y2H9T7_9FUNG|nr:mannosyltransferase putative-domain-containing protein [Catenaria anguillulae PL171]
MYRKPHDFSSDKLPSPCSTSVNASRTSLTIEEAATANLPSTSALKNAQHSSDVNERGLLLDPISTKNPQKVSIRSWTVVAVCLFVLVVLLWIEPYATQVGFVSDNPDVLNVREWSRAINANRQLYQSNSSLIAETNVTLVRGADPESNRLFDLLTLAADPSLLTSTSFPDDFDTNMPLRAPLIRLHRDLIRLAQAYQMLFPTNHDDALLWNVANKLETILYPWLPRPLLSMLRVPPNASNATPSPNLTAWSRPLHNSFGLVYPVGRKYARHVVVSLLSIHKLSKRDGMAMPPAVIVYAGEADLPRRYRERILAEAFQGGWIEARTQLAFVDVASMFVHGVQDVRRVGVTGWAIKPFALLFSPFQHSILVDADTLFLAHPFPLLTTADPGYLATGTTFFHDRTLFPIGTFDRLARNAVYPYIHWLDSWHPTGNVSTYVRQLRAWRGTSEHEMESGVVAVDKARIGVMLALVAACGLNAGRLREEQTYNVMHGDKESYWLAFELVGEPFAFIPGYGGTIGTSLPNVSPRSICGSLLHTDRSGRTPVWLNGGLEVDKHAPKERQVLLDMSHWIPDLDANGVEFRFGDGVVPDELGKVWNGMNKRWTKGVWEGTDPVGLEFEEAALHVA